MADPAPGFEPPRVIRPGIAAIEQPMPGHSLASNTCYLFATESGAIIVDPGYRRDDLLSRLEHGLRAIERSTHDIEFVLLTHNHNDHGQSAGDVRAATGAVVALHPDDWFFPETRVLTVEQLDAWGVPDDERPRLLERVIPDGAEAQLALTHGLELHTTNGPLRVLHTPGHTAGSVCLVMDAASLILTGDHVLPGQHPGAGIGGHFRGNPMELYLASLEAMGQYAGYLGLPGHGAPIEDVPGRATEIAEHHRRRGREIGAVVAARPGASVWDVARSIRWSGGFESLDPGRTLSALRQTGWLVELGERAAS